MRTLLLLFLLIAISFITAKAQSPRIGNYNNIGWYTYTGTLSLTNKWGLHTEYQWRRNNFVTSWQQSLLRTGINYYANKKLTLRIGYAWAETYPYGDIPLNKFGKTFTEHRVYQMATVTDKMGIVDLSHRFMLEQRWVGAFSTADITKEDTWNYMNRLRYMARVQIPFKKDATVKFPYAVVYDEIFIGFGKKVGENIFDQNRIGVLLGYKFSNTINIEAGYLSQIVQLGREVNGSNVFQYNNGFIVNTVFRFNLTKE
jgi:hypothetical protein